MDKCWLFNMISKPEPEHTVLNNMLHSLLLVESWKKANEQDSAVHGLQVKPLTILFLELLKIVAH